MCSAPEVISRRNFSCLYKGQNFLPCKHGDKMGLRSMMVYFLNLQQEVVGDNLFTVFLNLYGQSEWNWFESSPLSLCLFCNPVSFDLWWKGMLSSLKMYLRLYFVQTHETLLHCLQVSELPIFLRNVRCLSTQIKAPAQSQKMVCCSHHDISGFVPSRWHIYILIVVSVFFAIELKKYLICVDVLIHFVLLSSFLHQ